MGNSRIIRISYEAEVESATGLAGKSVVLGPGPGPETSISIYRFMKKKTDWDLLRCWWVRGTTPRARNKRGREESRSASSQFRSGREYHLPSEPSFQWRKEVARAKRLEGSVNA